MNYDLAEVRRRDAEMDVKRFRKASKLIGASFDVLRDAS
jgi:hypothetical protein